MSQFKDVAPERAEEIQARVRELDIEIALADWRKGEHLIATLDRGGLLDELYGC